MLSNQQPQTKSFSHVPYIAKQYTGDDYRGIAAIQAFKARQNNMDGGKNAAGIVVPNFSGNYQHFISGALNEEGDDNHSEIVLLSRFLNTLKIHKAEEQKTNREFILKNIQALSPYNIILFTEKEPCNIVDGYNEQDSFTQITCESLLKDIASQQIDIKVYFCVPNYGPQTPRVMDILLRLVRDGRQQNPPKYPLLVKRCILDEETEQQYESYLINNEEDSKKFKAESEAQPKYMFHQYNVEHMRDANVKFKTHHIQELYYIAHLDNLKSILENGILSHKRAGKSFAHTDISNGGVQDIRASKILERAILNKKPLSIHRHAVLYLNPHNAMMFVIMKDEPRSNVCIVRVNKDILKRGDAVISSKNASVGDAVFFTKDAYNLNPKAADKLVNNKSYYHNDREQEERKQIRQSEVLLPYAISSLYFMGIIVKNDSDKEIVSGILTAASKQLPIEVVPSVFFQNKSPYPLEDFPPVENVTEIQDHDYPASSEDEAEDKPKSPPIKLIIG